VTSVLRVLGPGDEPLVEAWLGPRVDSSLFLLGNLRTAGLVDTGATYSATWVAALEGGSVAGVAAHCWNGVLLVQAGRELGDLARAALAASGRPLAGLSGPRDQVVSVRGSLGLAEARTALDHEAELFSLDLDALVAPASLALGDVVCALPSADELPLLVEWRIAYAVETLGSVAGDGLRATCAGEVGRLVEEGNAFVLREAGVPVAFSGFNARLRDVVQVGGVYTPPALRGRGFARAVVAGSLLRVRDEGVVRAVLFTERENVAARRAYLALGFRVVGDYGMVLFETPVTPVR
jgi:GNAT superfamily N-acetyltransferase